MVGPLLMEDGNCNGGLRHGGMQCNEWVGLSQLSHLVLNKNGYDPKTTQNPDLGLYSYSLFMCV